MSPVELLVSLKGRINRQAFWLAIVPLTLSGVLGWLLSSAPDSTTSVVGGVLGLSVVWPLYAVSVKRWHDRDKSAWWILIGAVPIVGQLWAFIECGLMPGTRGYNGYGEPPPRLLLLNQGNGPELDPGARAKMMADAADKAVERVSPDLAGLMKVAGLIIRSDAESNAEKFEFVRDYLSSDLDLDADTIEDAIAIAWGARFSRDSFQACAEAVKSAHELEAEVTEAAPDEADEIHGEASGQASSEPRVDTDNSALNDISDFLFKLAMVDESLSETEEILLTQLHTAFGFRGHAFSSHKQMQGSWQSEYGPHAPVGGRRKYYAGILGLEDKITPEEVKRAYRELVKQYHPDKVTQLGPKLQEAAGEETRKINEAYAYFSKEFSL